VAQNQYITTVAIVQCFFTNLGVINNLRWDSIRNLAMLFTRTYNKLTRWQICGGWHFYSDLVTVGCNSYKDV
jgi:hypothetical protein